MPAPAAAFFNGMVPSAIASGNVTSERWQFVALSVKVGSATGTAVEGD